jgi:signal transduction histidine kinase
VKFLFHGLGWRVFLAFSTLLIALVLTLSFLGLKFAQKMFTDSASNEVRVLSVVISEQIEKYLKRVETDLRILSAGGSQIDRALTGPNPNLNALENILKLKKANSQNYKNLAIFDLEGRCIVSTHEAWVGKTAKREAFFIGGLKRRGYVDIFDNDEEEKSLLLALPINEGMDPHGVLTAQIKLSVLYDLIGKKIGLQGSNEAYLFDSAFRLISPETGVAEEGRVQALLSSPLISHLHDSFWVGKYQNHSSQPVLGTATEIMGRPWYLVVEKEFSEIENQLVPIRKALWTTTAVLLVALILISILLTQSITRPLRALVSEARRIASGDWHRSIAVPSGLDEITFLSQEFDKMRAQNAASQGRLIEKLEESERLAAIGTLASSLAHEIRNPLNALSLQLAKYERSATKNAEWQKFSSSMRGEIARLDKLVSDILDYARPLKLELESRNFKKLFDEIINIYGPVLESQKIFWKYDSRISEDFQMKCDANKMKQAILNLIKNSMEAMEAGGEIIFNAETLDKAGRQWLKFTVSDSGSGFPEEIQSRLFDLFFTTKDKGTGLGLSMVRKIIDAHGGEIKIERRQPKGTSVTVFLPAMGNQE